MTNAALYYQHHVFCCTNQRAEGHKRGCCASKGAERLRNYMKKKCKDLQLADTRINGAGCLDRCELGACLVVYPEGVWYRAGTEADIDLIISEHLQNGRIVDALRLPR